MVTSPATLTFPMTGMFSVVFFFINLLIEYRYDLFPPGSGPAFPSRDYANRATVSLITESRDADD